ncbi:MAG TPA: hypothetical protein VKZ77_03380 [Bacillaceae bacterium]|nr:hypothetical protein [Bacillaceae bacterium]
MKRKQIIIFISIVILLLIVDTAYKTYSKTKAEHVNKISDYKQKYEEAKEKNIKLEEIIASLDEELDIMEQEYTNLEEEYYKSKDETSEYLISNDIGIQIYHAMVNGDTATLQELTSPNIKVIDHYFEKTVNGITTKISFKNIQDAAIRNVDPKTFNFGYDEERDALRILYVIDHPQNSSRITCKMYIKKSEEIDNETGSVSVERRLLDIDFFFPTE